MIHNNSLIDTADALNRIEYGIDLLKVSLLVNEFYSQKMFVLNRDELVSWLVELAISDIEENVAIALKSIDFESVIEIRLRNRAMLESNSRSGDEKSTNNGSDG